MRLLFLTPAYPPFLGGGERYVRSLALTLQQRGHTVTVVTSTAAAESDFWSPPAQQKESQQVEEGIELIRCRLRPLPGARPQLLAWRKAMVLLSGLPGNQVARLKRMARKFPPIVDLETTLDRLRGRYDLLHGFNLSWEYPLLAGWHYAQKNNLPLFITPFTHFGEGVNDRVARNNLMQHQRGLLAAAAGIFPLTTVEANGLAAIGLPPEQLTVTGSGLDPLPDHLPPTDIQQKYQLPPQFILFIGRASHDKGAIHAAQAVQQLNQAGTQVTLLLVGQTAPEFDRYYKHLPEPERQWIRPLGRLSEADKHALLRLASSLVLPSRTDSFGIVFLEAWAYGTPVIGAHAGGIPGVITHNENGLLVPFNDIPALAQAIRSLLSDSTLAKRLGQQGQTSLKKQYTWEHVAELVAHRYRQQHERSTPF